MADWPCLLCGDAGDGRTCSLISRSSASGSDPIKKKQKTKKRSPFQRDLDAGYLSNTAESAEVRRRKENKGKQSDFTFRDDFVVFKEKKGDLCCVAGPSLLAEKHGLPSLSNQYELEKNSLGSNTLSGEVDCHRSKKRKFDVASLHNNLAVFKEGIRSTEVDRKAHDVASDDNSAVGLQVDGNIQSVVQKGEIIEEITPSKEKKRRKRRNRLKTNTNEKRIEETVLFEQNHIDRNSISMDAKVNNHKPFKGMDTDTLMVEPKSAVVKNSTSSVENVPDGSSVEISAGNLVEKPVLNTARRCGRRKAGKQIDQVLEDNVEDRDDNNLVTDSAMVELKSAVVGNSTTLGDVQNGSMVEISAGNSVDKPVLDTAKRCRRRKKAGKQIGQVLTDNVEARDDANSVQVCLEESSKANKIVSKCESSVEENVKALTICEKGLPSLTDKCVVDGSLSLDLGHVSNSHNKVSTSPSRRKLLILDLNGLLADIVSFQPDRKPDLKVARKSLYKRPFCDDFLKFCFKRFNVGVWSSRTEDNTRTVVNFLMEGFKHKLLFCWGQSKCTVTGFHTVENRQKPLFLKELRKLWDKEEPDLPWEKGDYGPANTLLLDDSPYKALRNPPFTAIFPTPYTFKDENDNTLGPGGDLRVYLEGIAMADDVPHYVERHPFGQRAITDTNPSWSFYLQVIGDDKNSLLPS